MIACADNNGRIRDYCHRGSEACELARGEPILPSCQLQRRLFYVYFNDTALDLTAYLGKINLYLFLVFLTK